ncbi:MAG: site-2 protease family protein, partial [Leptospiraceae bacterium]|nr:site-2 protease family protein [Leptospiraceae bacterium]
MKSNILYHIFLALATLVTLTLKEAIFPPYDESLLISIILSEIPYSASLFIILLSHEMGHYVPARYYGIDSTLPYFIPMPFGPIGTMGAVIKINEPIPDKKKLFDIGIGGPLMSFILSIPCWIIGIYYSELIEIKEIANPDSLILGDSLFTYYSVQMVHGPYNPDTFDIMIHPLARAGWVGFVITAINLLPFGQLDGGHIIYALFGEKYRNWLYYLLVIFLFMGFVNFSWVIWGIIIYFLIKVEHPFVPDSNLELGRSRVFLGWFMLIS